MSPWSREVVSDGKQLAFPARKKGNTKTVPCPPWFKSVPRGSTHGKQTIHLMPDRYILREIDTLLPVTSNTACYCVFRLVTGCCRFLLFLLPAQPTILDSSSVRPINASCVNNDCVPLSQSKSRFCDRKFDFLFH